MRVVRRPASSRITTCTTPPLWSSPCSPTPETGTAHLKRLQIKRRGGQGEGDSGGASSLTGESVSRRLRRCGRTCWRRRDRPEEKRHRVPVLIEKMEVRERERAARSRGREKDREIRGYGGVVRRRSRRSREGGGEEGGRRRTVTWAVRERVIPRRARSPRFAPAQVHGRHLAAWPTPPQRIVEA